ncbi:lactonase family protein [Thermodesulfobacteriota bacterium]
MADDKALVFVASIRDNAVLSYELDLKNGNLTPVGRPLEVGWPWAMALSPDKHFLYVAAHKEHIIATLEINEDVGDLKLVDIMPLKKELGLKIPTYIHVDSFGKHLLACDYYFDKLGSYQIGGDGCLKGDTADVVTVGTGWRGPIEDRAHPHSIRVDPSGKYAVVAFTGKDHIDYYKWDPENGSISQEPVSRIQTKGGTGPRHCAYHPTRSFVYFVMERGERPSRVTLFDVVEGEPFLKEKGTWMTIPESFTEHNIIADVHITPDGRFVYVSNRGHDSLAEFAISEEDGSLTPLGQVKTSIKPTTFAIDDSGRFALSAGNICGRLSAHRINKETGRLSLPKIIDCVWYGDETGRKQKHDKPYKGDLGAPWVMTRPR